MAAASKRDYDFLFKLVLIGDSGVGKSCLLLRFSVSTLGKQLCNHLPGPAGACEWSERAQIDV